MAKRRNDKYLVKAVPPQRKGAPFILMSNKLVAESNVSIMLNWIKEKPAPNPIHAGMETHPYDEIIINIGADPHHPEELGAEIEGYLGNEQHHFNTTTALFIPRDLAHGGVLWKSFDRPHLQLVIKLTGELEAGPPGASSGKAPAKK